MKKIKGRDLKMYLCFNLLKYNAEIKVDVIGYNL